MRHRQLWILALGLALAGCSDDGGGGDGGGGACPQIAGTYTITAHCVAAQIGTEVNVEQSGCTLTRFDPWTGWSGTISPGGGMSWSGDAGGTAMTCTGSYSQGVITGACTPTCDVTLTRK